MKLNQLFFRSLSLLLATGTLSSTAFAGARIYFDLDKATAVIRADFRYFGDVRPEILEKTTQIIAKQWQGEPTREGDTDVYPLYLTFKGQLRISTDIRAIYLPSIEAAKEEFKTNRQPWINYIRVEQNFSGQISSKMKGFSNDEISGNLGFFLYDDRIDQSTTASHELVTL